MLGRSIFSESWFQWGTALVVGFPLAVFVLGELLTRLERRQSLLAAPMRLLRNVFLPLLVAALFLQRVAGIENDPDQPSTVFQVSATIISVVGLAILLSIVRGLITAKSSVDSWPGRAPRLLVDIARFVLLGIGTLLVLSNVWGLSITGTVAALGIGGIVVGLALQDTLASLIGGMAILSEKPFGVGDWIELDGTEGKVTDINWRTVRLRNRQKDLIVVPNIVFGNQVVINNSQPEIEHVETITLGFSYDDPPNAVKSMLEEVVNGTPDLVAGSPIDIRCVGYDDFSVRYEVWLDVTSYDVMPRVRDHFMTRIWYAAKRHGIAIPFPIRTVHHFDGGELPQLATPEMVQRRVRGLSAGAINEKLADQLQRSATESSEAGERSVDNHVLSFAAGETLQVEGGDSRGLGLILSGTAVGLSRENQVITLTEGDVFGEQGMLGSRTNLLTIRALTDVEAVVVGGRAADSIAQSNMGFAEEIQSIMLARRAALVRSGSIDLTEGGQRQ